MFLCKFWWGHWAGRASAKGRGETKEWVPRRSLAQHSRGGKKAFWSTAEGPPEASMTQGKFREGSSWELATTAKSEKSMFLWQLEWPGGGDRGWGPLLSGKGFKHHKKMKGHHSEVGKIGHYSYRVAQAYRGGEVPTTSRQKHENCAAVF